MGKVGSSTIRHHTQSLCANVLHTHDHVVANRFVVEHPRDTTILVTGVREPIVRCISAFFQNIDNVKHPLWYIGSREAIKEMSINDISAFFVKRIEKHIDTVVAPWFDNFANAIDCNPLTHQFDPTIGHVSIETDRLRIHIYKLERINEFIDFFHRTYSFPEVQITPQNVGNSKWSGVLYSQFIDEVRLPEATVQRLHTLPWVQHFYSAQELDAAAQRFLVV